MDAGSNFSDDDTYHLNTDTTRDKICDVRITLEYETFLAAANGNLQQSKMAMAMGSVTKYYFRCKLFEMIKSEVAESIATISTVQYGCKASVGDEHLSKIFRISHEEAEKTIAATSKINHQYGNT